MRPALVGLALACQGGQLDAQPAAATQAAIIDVPPNSLVDLDTGRLSAGGADLWFQPQTASLTLIIPRNGATVAVGDRTDRGPEGCRAAAMTESPIPLGAIPVGSYVCVWTSEGRASQFRVNDLAGSPATLTLAYTTWP
jgi:hypothetical protein